MADSNGRKCILKNVNGTHPNIEITSTESVYVGRTPQTCIQDMFVSRKHLHIRVDFQVNTISIEVMGINQAALNGQILERNEQYTAHHGDVIEIIPRKYQYKIEFQETEQQQNGTDATTHKRKLSAENMITSVTKRVKCEIEIKSDAKQPFPDDDRWESFNNGEIIIYTAPDCGGKSKIGAYDMDGTLIKTKSGKVFPVNPDDWKIAFGTVISTLRRKAEENYKIVILTNQAGVSSGKTKLKDLKKKIEDIIKVIDIPMQVFIATSEGFFRKPLPGMWQILCDLKNDGVPVDLDNSYYVGDAAGRPENKFLKRKKDHSTVDRLMALNLDIQFFTPEEHFLKANSEKWVQPEFQPRKIDQTMLIEPASSKLISSELEVVVMVGGPGSGKSRFCEDYLKCEEYEIISRDKIGTWQKCVDHLNDCLKTGRKAVIDNTNVNKESRQRYINAAKKANVKCRCFRMTTSPKHAQHNIAFRELIDSNHSKINQMVLNTFKKNFEEPTLDEGFSEIVKINFIPNFKNQREKELYNMYLLSS